MGRRKRPGSERERETVVTVGSKKHHHVWLRWAAGPERKACPVVAGTKWSSTVSAQAWQQHIELLPPLFTTVYCSHFCTWSRRVRSPEVAFDTPPGIIIVTECWCNLTRMRRISGGVIPMQKIGPENKARKDAYTLPRCTANKVSNGLTVWLTYMLSCLIFPVLQCCVYDMFQYTLTVSFFSMFMTDWGHHHQTHPEIGSWGLETLIAVCPFLNF